MASAGTGPASWAGVAAAALGLWACAGEPPVGATPEALLTQNGLSVNGLSVNGLSVNGMSVNGLSVNGLSVNGLSVNGLATPDFLGWFESNPALSAKVMRYIARCALPAGESLSWEWNGHSYVWTGVLGLAPGWAGGEPISEAEQQLVTACLAAHSNKFGLHVALSVRGPLSDGQSFIPLDPGEEDLFAKPEGCFFGNLFDGSGIYSGALLDAWAPQETNPRGCAVEVGLPGSCPPIEHVGSCHDVCRAAPAPEGAPVVYESCTVNVDGVDVTFLPLTTYLSPPSVYTCGDDICQFTESPFDPDTGLGCLSDCGSL
ncbi:MAG TPA: hypothetical protein VFR85_06805 [Anaeromyxobacteraceae bacterium]|nr:hypothetical protein [Anaeromyxobacteraceae bacterium]